MSRYRSMLARKCIPTPSNDLNAGHKKRLHEALATETDVVLSPAVSGYQLAKSIASQMLPDNIVKLPRIEQA